MRDAFWQKSQSLRRKYNLASKWKCPVSFCKQVSGCNIKKMRKVLKIGQQRSPAGFPLTYSMGWGQICLLSKAQALVMGWQGLKAEFAEEKWGGANATDWTLCCRVPPRSVEIPGADCSVPYLAKLPHQT